MPRNAQGLYTLPAGNPVVPGTIIESVWANGTMSDIADALTNSLPRNGSAPMTGPLTLNGAAPTNARHAVDKQYVDQFMAFSSGMPIGAVSAFGGLFAPAGWLKCDGQAVSRAVYSDLFALVGTTYGAGDNSTTFNVPDLRNEFVRGRVDARAIGSKQAASFAAHIHPMSDPGHAHTQAAHGHTITTGSHGHGVNDPGHSHNNPQGLLAGAYSNTDNGGGFLEWTNVPTQPSGTGISIAAAGNLGGSADQQAPVIASAVTSLTMGVTGGAETVPQNMALDYYIKALQDAAGVAPITGIDTSDAQMISVDNSNLVVPELVIHSNVAFGVVKLDAAGQIPVNLMPTTGVTYQGQLDASSGNLPVGTFVTGDFYNIAVGGTLSLRTSVGGPVPTVVVVGDQIIYDETISGWWYNAASSVASMPATAVTFVPHGTIAATNAQAAIEELDSEKAPTSAGTATGTSFVPAGTIAASNVQAAIQELDNETQSSLSGKAPSSAATATGTSFTPNGNVAATNVQAAIQELDSEKMPIAGGTFSGQVAVQVPSIPAAPVRFDMFSFTPGSNGNAQLPGGMQLRWGSGNGGGTPNVTIDFADFSQGCNAFVVSGDINNPVVENFGARTRFSTEIVSGGGGNVWGYSWFAIGS